MWEFLLGVVTVLVLLILALAGLWRALRAGYKAYVEACEDGQITDSEKICLADALIEAIDQTKNVITFIRKLILLFRNFRK
jgi:hypothetical protein